MTQIEALKVLSRGERFFIGIPAEARMVLFDIAQNPGTNILDAARRLDLTVARLLNIVAKLSERSWFLKRGLDLVTMNSNGLESKQRTLHLSDKGQRLIHRLMDSVGSVTVA